MHKKEPIEMHLFSSVHSMGSSIFRNGFWMIFHMKQPTYILSSKLIIATFTHLPIFQNMIPVHTLKNLLLCNVAICGQMLTA